MLTVVALLLTAGRCAAQEGWPRTIVFDSGEEIHVFQPEIIRYDRMTVQFKSVFSIQAIDPEIRLFGMLWVTARVAVDSVNGLLKVKSYTVDMLRMPDDGDSGDRRMIWAALRADLQEVITELPLGEAKRVAAGGENGGAASREKGGGAGHREPWVAGQLPRVPAGPSDASPTPLVFFRPRPAALIVIDGLPRLEYSQNKRVDEVLNSSAPMIRNDDGLFYLYSGSRWYRSASALGPYTVLDNRMVSDRLQRIGIGIRAENYVAANAVRFIDPEQATIRSPNDPSASQYSLDSEIVVSTAPALLIQSIGEPQFEKIGSTSLSFVSNSDNDIFLDSTTHFYFLQLAGRWYRSRSLEDDSGWEEIQSFDLPESFLRIPNSSEKADVRQYIAGTDEADNKMLDRQVPVVFRTDRYRITHVGYCGQPWLKRIEGTRLKYAPNTASIVLYDGKDYFTLENGVWFISNNPRGLWTISDRRPADLDLIPSRYGVSRAKFVDVYGVTAESVWSGYLPGYFEQQYDTSTCQYSVIGFPFLGPAYVAVLLKREKQGKVRWPRPRLRRQGLLFSKEY